MMKLFRIYFYILLCLLIFINCFSFYKIPGAVCAISQDNIFKNNTYDFTNKVYKNNSHKSDTLLSTNPSDITPPRIDIISPESNSSTDIPILNIKLKVTDDLSGVDRVLIYREISDENKKLITSFFKNVKKLSFTPLPGPIESNGEDIIPLVLSSSDSTPKNSTVAAISLYKKGYVFAFGHDGFLADSNINLNDNVIFLTNILKSVPLLSKNIVVLTGRSEWLTQNNTKQLVSFCNSQSFNTTFFSGRVSDDLLKEKGIVIIGAAWSDFTQNEIESLVKFVENGGTLFLGGLGWSWLSNTSLSLKKYPMNILGGMFGFYFTEGVIKEPSNVSQQCPFFVRFFPSTYNSPFGPFEVEKKYTNLNSDGSIEDSFTLNLGINQFNIVAFDKEGNVYTRHFTTTLVKNLSIISSANSGGLISPSGTVSVNSGDSKTFTIAPSSGYKIKDVKVDGVSVGIVSTYTFTNITSNHSIEAIFEKQSTEIIIILHIGNSSFTVNNEIRYLDSPPIIKNNRTLLPIRAIVEALGGTVTWNESEKSVDIVLGTNHLILQIGNHNAYVNGVQKFIDPSNLKVRPEIVNGRTMLPLRFVAENLGCSVQWDDRTKTITITYKFI